MIESSLPRTVAIAAIERRIQWRIGSTVAFIGIMLGLGGVAILPELHAPERVTGLPDDPDLRAAIALVRGRTLAEQGTLRFTSSLLGEGALGGPLSAPARARAGRAAERVLAARERFPRDPRVWAALGSLELVQGRYVQAERFYRAALAHDSHYGEARLGLGATLALRARVEPAPLKPRALDLAAIAQFAAVPENDPAHAHALFDRAVLLRQVGRRDEARRCAQRYLVLDPSSAWAKALEPATSR